MMESGDTTRDRDVPRSHVAIGSPDLLYAGQVKVWDGGELSTQPWSIALGRVVAMK
jgi:hypothetical protein